MMEKLSSRVYRRSRGTDITGTVLTNCISGRAAEKNINRSVSPAMMCVKTGFLNCAPCVLPLGVVLKLMDGWPV